jgi:hypothetical protein
MAEQETFDLERDVPNFLSSLLERTKDIYQRAFDREIAKTHAVALEKNISLVRTICDCFSLDPNDRHELDLLSKSLTNVLSSWMNYIDMGPIIPTTVAGHSAATEIRVLTPCRPSALSTTNISFVLSSRELNVPMTLIFLLFYIKI